MRRIATFIFSFLFSFQIFSQQTEDRAIPMTATYTTAPAEVTLSWGMEGLIAEQEMYRRAVGEVEWSVVLDEAGANLSTSYVDTDVAVGGNYEYALLQLNFDGILAFNYAFTPIEIPVVDDRGTVLIFVEDDLQTPLAVELERLNLDLLGDGWQTVWHPVSDDATVETVKAQIVSDYTAAPDAVKSVFLLGEIPVPYSGLVQWDGHSDHNGAWVADTYYGDMDGEWTDETVNNTSASRPANHNVPGDGKFDNNFIPTPVELAVGRVDFSNLSESTFGTSRTELMRRYLDKNHRWRAKEYTVENKGLVDDNFGYFNGEAFAASGYRNFYNLVGFDNVTDGDFFDDTDDQSFLYAYGCGGGSYTSANGVGNSNDFAADSVNAVFTMLFGSYHGDWDSENNPFMMSALASRGGILSCSWAGRPHWFYHPLGTGRTLGDCALISQNVNFDVCYLGSFGNSGAHTTLLGDPTLRAHIVAPVTDVEAVAECNSVQLSWTANAAVPGFLGYHVYRSDALEGNYERLSAEPVPDAFFVDGAPLPGDNFYQIKTVVLEQTPTGAYQNTSTGTLIQTTFEEVIDLTVSGETHILCAGGTTLLEAMSNTPETTFEWDGLPDPTNPIQTVAAGTYTVTAISSNGCTISEEILVTENSPMGISFIAQIDCEGFMDFTIDVMGGEPPYTIVANPMTPIPPNTDFEVIVIDAFGCSSSLQSFNPPFTPLTASIDHTDETIAGLNDGTATAETASGEPPFEYEWSNGGNTQAITDLPPGEYTVTVTGANGCTSTATVEVMEGIVSTSEIPGLVSLDIYPNPTGGHFSISLFLENRADISFSITDIYGKIISASPKVFASEYKWEMDMSEFPAGVYLCKIMVGENMTGRRVIFSG